MIRKAEIMVILGLLALCGTVWGVDGNDPISHWTFDEGEGDIAYDSFGDNDGTIYGATWTTGQIGGALSFDGVDDYIEIADDDSLTPEDQITVSFWTYRTVGGGATINKYAKCPNESASPGNSRAYTIIISGETNKVSVYICSSVNNVDSLKSNNIIPLNEWHYITVTFNHGDAAIYIDGQLDISETMSVTSIMNDHQPLTIGAFWSYCGVDHLSTLMHGQIDEVSIYNRALSAEEVQQLYQGEVIELEIIGPNEVAENFSASYKAIAHYESGSTKDVTDSADWQVEPSSFASIEAGLLSTESINWPQEDITIYAQYTEGEVTVEAEKEVLLFAICPSGSALSFEGDDYVSVPDSASLDITGDEITVVAWFKPGATGNNNRPIVSKWLGSNSAYVLLYKTGSVDLIGFAVNTGGTAVGANPTPVNDINKWYHLAGVYDGSYITVYVDGVPGEPVANTGNINNSSKSLRISGYGEGAVTPHHIIGLVDYVQLYDRALSAEEIRANMHTRLSGDEPGLVGYWDFDEGEGQAAYDLSPYGNDGQLGSTPDADASDPAWVNSDAPIGICTLEELVERNLSDVLDIKLDILEQLGIALAQEEAVVNMLNTSFENRDFGDAKKKDVVKAKQKIHSAMQHEEQAEAAVDNSIEKLEDALTALGL